MPLPVATLCQEGRQKSMTEFFSNELRKETTMNYELDIQSMELNLDDLLIADPEIAILSDEDARAIPELGASYGTYFCCTLCSSSSGM